MNLAKATLLLLASYIFPRNKADFKILKLLRNLACLALRLGEQRVSDSSRPKKPVYGRWTKKIKSAKVKWGIKIAARVAYHTYN